MIGKGWTRKDRLQWERGIRNRIRKDGRFELDRQDDMRGRRGSLIMEELEEGYVCYWQHRPSDRVYGKTPYDALKGGYSV